MKRLNKFSFGATSAILTSMALIVGLGSISSNKSSLIGALLVIAIVDNVSDTLGIHIYQESEALADDIKYTNITITNYGTRLIITLSFIVLLLLLPNNLAKATSVIWGAIILSVLTYFISKNKGTKPAPEVFKHLLIAFIVIIISQVIGNFIRFLV
jgi:VIT1/CCC1 family predicted Fe2+/Mn2+ transporter